MSNALQIFDFFSRLFPSLQYDIFALLGRFNASDESELNWVRRNISKKNIHEDFKHGDPEHVKSDADIAILVMDSPVEFTDFIQPICLPLSTESVSNVRGTVAGYGIIRAGQALSETPLQTSMDTVDQAVCLASDRISTHILSLRSFCAHHPNPCESKKNLQNLEI